MKNIPSTTPNEPDNKKNVQNYDTEDYEEDEDAPTSSSLTIKPNSLSQPTIIAGKPSDPLSQVKDFPKGCYDLRRRGQSLDGFYMVKSAVLKNKIDTIYCDFSNLTFTRSTTGSPTGGPTGGEFFSLDVI